MLCSAFLVLVVDSSDKRAVRRGKLLRDRWHGACKDSWLGGGFSSFSRGPVYKLPLMVI